MGADAPSGRDAARVAMEAAFGAAREAGARNEVPVGAAVIDAGGRLLAACGNAVEARRDASAHAELLAMRRAAREGTGRLVGCTIAVTLEPCAMCAAAMVHFRIARVVFGAYDPKGGGVDHGARVFAAAGCLHVPEVVGGVREREATDLLRGFFETLRRRSQPYQDE